MDYCHARQSQTSNNSNSSNSNTSGSDFLNYEVDTVQHDGQVSTDIISCSGAGSLGTVDSKMAVLKDLLPHLKILRLIGVGVTEAGMAHCHTKAMKDLYELLDTLRHLYLYSNFSWKCDNPNGKISIVNMDNVPQNGSLLHTFMLELANESSNSNNGDNEEMKDFLTNKLVFHNTMVDRITSQRPGSNGLVPRAEPTPLKALVIEDLEGDLPRGLIDDIDIHIHSSSSNTSKNKTKTGVVVRRKAGQLDADIALKLRVANGTHTGIAHVMALCGLLMTDALNVGQSLSQSQSVGSNDDDDDYVNNSAASTSSLLMNYLDSLFQHQILKAVEGNNTGDLGDTTTEDVQAVYDDWRGRLMHAHFGLSTFFITQNCAAKGGIRLGPTIVDLLKCGEDVKCSTIFALAAILRFLTPATTAVPGSGSGNGGIYRGWLDKTKRSISDAEKGSDESSADTGTTEYADGLSYNLQQGWYEFRCVCNIQHVGREEPQQLPVVLGSFPTTMQPCDYEDVVRGYLLKSDGGNLSSLASDPSTKEKLDVVVRSVATIYARMVAGDGMLELLKELPLRSSCEILVDGSGSNFNTKTHIDDYRPLYYCDKSVPSSSLLMKANLGNDRDRIRSIVFAEVQSAHAIDLHTHLLPPSHGALCLWGIDELLTYHYLVAEYFMTAPPTITPEGFYAKSKQDQADLIWQALFIDRSPISEACRGVITTLIALGLRQQVGDRDLGNIRKFYSNYRDAGASGAEEYSKLVYQKAGVRYAVMTNIPFDPMESQHWRPTPKEYSSNFRSALRVDPLLAGDQKTIERALKVAGYNTTMEDARQYIRDWCDTMHPEYMMASTPHDFVLPEDKGSVGVGLGKEGKLGVNQEAMKQPFAFTDLTAANSCTEDCSGGEDGLASIIDEQSDFLSEVLMTVCEERDLPVALKIGAHRAVNPAMQQAGDGVVAFADSNMLARLCTRFPKVRFLATFLSRNNQHEACVLATKFRNLHIYGCWWFCNNPSIIEEITKMRVEMLGTAFTAQHSDSRVLDQLIYKWAHSRAVIANVLTKEYVKLIESGWSITRGELRRDIERLFGTSYEEFMQKSLV